jgi:hypothetical protein
MVELAQGRQNTLKETYKMILTSFCKKIMAAHRMGKTQVTLQVPQFVLGRPIYQLGPAVEYVGRQLVRLGYNVTYVGINSFMVNWKIKPTGKVEMSQEYPHLSSLAQTAERIRVSKLN